MSDCIFCKIISGELPSHKVYEDAAYLAFLDIHPVNPGHTLVIPKAHYPDLLSTPAEVARGLMEIVQRIAPLLLETVKSNGFNVGINNGVAAGQIIFHTHLHIMPRFSEDGLHLWGAKSYEPGEMERIANAVRTALK